MSKKDSKKTKVSDADETGLSTPILSPQAKRILWALFLLVLALIIILSAFGAAGIAGQFIYNQVLEYLFGFGVVLIPVILATLAIHLFQKERVTWTWIDYVSSFMFLISSLGLIHIITPATNSSGIIGSWIGNFMVHIFDVYAASLITGLVFVTSFMVLFNKELRILEKIRNFFTRKNIPDETTSEPDYELDETNTVVTKEELNEISDETQKQTEHHHGIQIKSEEDESDTMFASPLTMSESYEYPPLDLLGKSSGKPSVGDIKANANLIKRTLLNFGIDVEMDEVSIGPTVTRYALKPAEGIKLARIVALKSDLALALAAHPIRIEAPIPGKSLVGIEIPNRTASNVGLGSLLAEDQFENAPNRLTVALGKGVTGKSYFANLAKLPHLLIAGTTGSGKSVTVHNLILSLVYRNGPEDLRLILVDPKRVELTLYNDIPHLLTPVIKEPKKAILALKWTAKEMERRYEILEKAKCRDIQSYHKSVQEPFYSKIARGKPVPEDAPYRMPYIVVFIDELADIMQAYPRELESGIVRLAQMSRAVGIHLILSTQRPSVNVITGLIKANIPSRIALQVASQIDSRTILDAPGAESLLGKGDMLYQGEGMSKPERMQCANVDETQVKAVVSFIKKHNGSLPDEISLGETLENDRTITSSTIDDDDDDELYEDARAVVIEAGKGSTSYIQRKLKVGYSRAARLMDLLEERGVIGPADGAKPREVLDKRIPTLSTDQEPSALDEEPL